MLYLPSITFGGGVCVCVNQGFIVIELKLSYEPLAHLHWRTQVSADFPTPDGRRFGTGSSVVHGARI